MRLLGQAGTLALLFLAVGCESTTDPEVEAGTLSFTWQAFGQTGTVQATGMIDFDLDGELVEEAFAVAISDLSDAEGGQQFTIPLLILAGQPVTGGGSNFVQFLVSGRTTGEYPFDPECDVQSQRCASGFAELAASGQDGGDIELVSGALRVTDVDDERIRGTFSGTAEIEIFNQNTGTFTTQTATISAGAFDLPVLSEEDLRRMGADL